MPEKSGIFYLSFDLFLYLPDIASITRFISLRSDFGATTSMLSMWCKSCEAFAAAVAEVAGNPIEH